MRYIRLKEANREALEIWLKKANKILQEMKNELDPRKRKAIIHNNRSHWRDADLLNFLKDLSDGKCWYTETKLLAEYPHLEHFRPKSCARNEYWDRCHDGYWWLAFDIGNYRLSKPMPNTRKGTYFPLRERGLAVSGPGIAISRESPMLLDPTVQSDIDLISFNALGEPEPCSEPIVSLTEWDRKRIEFSIKRYGLNNDDLCNERKALWFAITSQFDEYITLFQNYKDEECKESKGKAEQCLLNLEKYLAPDHVFTGLIKSCFDSHPVGKFVLKKLATYQQAA